MERIRFRNGADGAEILLDEQFETEKEARSRLPDLLHKYRTVDDAAAWLDGDEPPEFHVHADEAADGTAVGGDADATEAAVALAAAEGIDLSELHGSGAGGRVTKGDVEKAIKARDDAAEVFEWASPEYFAAWDATDADALVAAIHAWGTGAGTDDDPAVPKPPPETIAVIVEHEQATLNRPDVLATLAEKAAEG